MLSGPIEDDVVDGVVAIGVVVVVEDVGMDAASTPEDPDPDDPNEHTSLTLLQQSPFKPQNSSQKHASMVVSGCCTLPPQLSAHDNQGENTSVAVSGRGVALDDPDDPEPDEPFCVVVVVVVLVVLVVLKTTSIPLISTRTKLFRTPGVAHGAV